MGGKRKTAGGPGHANKKKGGKVREQEDFILHPEGVEETVPADDAAYEDVFAVRAQSSKKRRRIEKLKKQEQEEGEEAGEQDDGAGMDDDFGEIGWTTSEYTTNPAWEVGEDSLAGMIMLEEVDGAEFVQFNTAKNKKKPAQKKQKQKQENKEEEEDAGQVAEPRSQAEKRKKKKQKVAAAAEEKPAEAEMISDEPAEDEPPAGKKKKKTRAQKKRERLEAAKAAEEAAAAQVIQDGKDHIAALDSKGVANVAGSPWEKFNLDPLILRGISALGFAAPTPIQAATLPAAVRDWKDVIGAAQTGSGKTLAFGIPAVQRAVEDFNRAKAKGQPTVGLAMSSLILCPTRELALQVCKHIQAVAKYTAVKAVAIVGGMSEQKQTRVLGKRPHIVVGTPGRIWKLISEGDKHLCDVSGLRTFVLDEADRMVEGGHFPELTNFLKYLSAFRAKQAPAARSGKSMQMFLFSATATLAEQGRERFVTSGKHKHKRSKGGDDEENMIDQLVDRMGFDKNPHLVDLSTDTQTASTLEEFRIDCLADDKDFYAYYFLVQNPGKTLIFCNSISCLRRLSSVLTLMNLPVFPLHAQMQQRQRLKNLDRFKAAERAIIVCTDVAARGLDIPTVEYVLHYQLPRSSEVYIHRAGRTARAGRSGTSLALVDATDQRNYRTLCDVLDRPEGLPELRVEQSLMPMVKERVKVAQKIDVMANHNKQRQSKSDWFKKNAEAMDMILDDDLEDESDDEDAKQHTKLKNLRADLAGLLRQELVSTRVSRKFFTRNSTMPAADGAIEYNHLRR